MDRVLVEFGKQLEASTRRKSTKVSYRWAIRRFRAYLKTTTARKLVDITPKLAIEFIKSRDGLAPDTVLGEAKRMQALFGRCVRDGDLDANPFAHSDVRDVVPSQVKHERTFTDEELAQFLEGALTVTQSRQAQEYHDMFLFLSETGLRVGEALQERWCDIHLEAGGSFLRVEPHDGWEPKSKSSVRTVPLSPRVESMLRGFLAGADSIDPTARIWPANWTDNDATNNGDIGQQFRRIRDRLGLGVPDGKGQKLRVHSFRHYYATRLVRKGVDPATVRDLLGHTSISITNRYFNVPRSELFRAVAGAFAEPESVPKSVPDSTRLHTLPHVSARNSAI